MYVEKDSHKSFSDMPFVMAIFDEGHPLLKLGETIRWEKLLERLKEFYSKDKGSPTTPLRAQVGTLMLKFLKDMSDREAVQYVKENIYAQRFCALTPTQATDYMHPATGLSNLRGKIGAKGMAMIQEALDCAASGRGLKKGGRVIVDTTCVPADIIYPTDIRLLEQCRRKMIKLMKKAKEFGLGLVYRTYNRTGRKVYIQFSKFSRPTEKMRKSVHKKLYQFVRRNVSQVEDMREKAALKVGVRCRADNELKMWLKEMKETAAKVKVVLHQQGYVRRGLKHIPNRIVSIHRTHVRPIVRGKFPLNTEFGPKAFLAVAKGCLYVVDAFRNNVSDATLVVPALRWFKETFGRLPDEMLGDRGFYSRTRAKWLVDAGIRSGLQQRGKSPASEEAQRRMNRRRQTIEALISLGKRKFGWSRCRARIPEHELSWISLGAASLNVHRAFFIGGP